MKRKVYQIFGVAAVFGMAACGPKFQADEDTVYVTKDGTVISASIEDFNESYYDEDELENYITESVDDYVKSNGDGTLAMDRFEVSDAKEEGKTAKLYLEYSSYIDYAQFNGVDFFMGTVAGALEEGYPFEQNFLRVEDGKAADAADADTVKALEEEKIVIIGEATALQVDGTIQYISDGNVEMTGKRTAKISYDPDDKDAKPAYVIYK